MNPSLQYAQKNFAAMVVENGDVEAVQSLVDALLELKQEWSTEMPTEDGYYWFQGKPYYYSEESRLYLFGLEDGHFTEPGDEVGIFHEGFRPGLWLKIEKPQSPEIK